MRGGAEMSSRSCKKHRRRVLNNTPDSKRSGKGQHGKRAQDMRHAQESERKSASKGPEKETSLKLPAKD